MQNKQRELIERDRDYLRLKNVIFHNMNIDGVSPWMTEEEWLDTVPRMSVNKYRNVVNDLLDDAEIQREYDREQTPVKTRWIMRNPTKEQK